MKTLLGILAFTCWLSLTSRAQEVPAPTKVHFLNAMAAGTAELKTTVDRQNPIRIKPRTWVVIQPVGDSLGFIVDNKPYFLHFGAHKQYYFVIQVGHFSRPVLTEKSEQEFILTATIESAKGPEEYVLRKAAN